MKDIWSVIQIAIAAIGGWIGYFLGGLDGFLYALIAFVVIDYLTGIMVAIGHIIDQKLIGAGGAIRTAAIFFYISNEGISIIENSARVGLPVPKKIKAALEQLKSKGDDINE